ncbi:hypothetical protein BCO18175_05742 [Burkholderia contaminans]|nr:hypothetical protein BCO18175_05742 [Burkholderia contaminans]
MGRVPKGISIYWDKFEWGGRVLNVQTCAARNSLQAAHGETMKKPGRRHRFGGTEPHLGPTRFRPAPADQVSWVDTADCTSSSTCIAAFSYSV